MYHICIRNLTKFNFKNGVICWLRISFVSISNETYTISNDLDKDIDCLVWMQNGDFVHRYRVKNVLNTMKSEQNDLKMTFARACKRSSCEQNFIGIWSREYHSCIGDDLIFMKRACYDYLKWLQIKSSYLIRIMKFQFLSCYLTVCWYM